MMDAIVKHGEWWWPLSDIDARPVIERDCEAAIKALLPHIAGRDLIVQAGANVGLYPVALAVYFKSVITAEPEPTNFECLKRNSHGRDPKSRITALYAAFGETLGECQPLVLEARNCGAHMVTYGKGEIPVWTIDELELTACNAIWLDLEGSELFALRGAGQTVAKFSPTIAVEDKGLHRHFNIPDGELQAWFRERGYEQVARIGNDRVYRKPA